MCCHVHGHHEHSEYFFSVFDSDLTGDEADWLGTAVLPANSTAGSYELALSGGEFEVDADAPAPTLTVSIPLLPPPPPPPQNIDAVKVAPSRLSPATCPPTPLPHTRRGRLLDSQPLPQPCRLAAGRPTSSSLTKLRLEPRRSGGARRPSVRRDRE